MSLRFSERFLRFISSFNENRPTTSLLRDLTESISEVDIVLRSKISESLALSPATQLRLLRDIQKKHTVDMSDVCFTLIHCYRAYQAYTGITLKNPEYKVSIVHITKTLCSVIHKDPSLDVNSVYRALGFTSDKGINEQFDALTFGAQSAEPLNGMYHLGPLTDMLHRLNGNIVSNELSDRLKSLIPVANLGVLQESLPSERITALESRMFAPSANVIFDMHNHVNSNGIVFSMQSNRIFSIGIGSTGMLLARLKSTSSEFEMTFTPLATLELIQVALNWDTLSKGNNGYVGRDLSILNGDSLTLMIRDIKIFIARDEACDLFTVIKMQSDNNFFNEYVTYTRCTLGDI